MKSWSIFTLSSPNLYFMCHTFLAALWPMTADTGTSSHTASLPTDQLHTPTALGSPVPQQLSYQAEGSIFSTKGLCSGHIWDRFLFYQNQLAGTGCSSDHCFADNPMLGSALWSCNGTLIHTVESQKSSISTQALQPWKAHNSAIK